ncbi:Bug family tripartite tricarboxylate transporter substrate binding protein [Polaromonas jejuensis]|uniref:Bug family tripartite tricarboxylate transporter substrate binding protein n=1 Tax=Polaromonas jejuensis TaxID=457502 RepID=A0ABW0QDC8_9BURK|nr:tripartite tricarboxylate transporter substrate binding protein [Polaromonas jejuensis]
MTIVVPYPAGGSADRVVRVLAEKLPAQLSRPVIIDNKPGAGGRLAAGLVKSMPTDGSVVMVGINALVLQSIIYAGKNNFDLVRDYTPVAATVRSTMAIAVPPSLPIKNIKELVEYSKAHKNSLFYGSSGSGSMGHLTGVRLAKASGVEWSHAPYKGGAPLVADLLGGHVQVGIDGLAEYIEHHQQGRLRVIAVFSKERSPLAPEVPTIAEQGFASVADDSWHGIFAAAAVPKAQVAQIQDAIEKVLKDPEIQSKLAKASMPANFMPSAKFGEFVRQQFATWEPVIRSANITPE